MTAMGKHGYEIVPEQLGTKILNDIYLDEIVRPLHDGEGAFGKTFLVKIRRHAVGSSLLAVIKVLSPSHTPEKFDAAKEEFRNENAILSSLNAPNISQIYGFGNIKITDVYAGGERETPCYCCQYIPESITLTSLINAKGILHTAGIGEAHKTELLNTLFFKDALASLLKTIIDVHLQDVVHLDLHPGNILIVPEHRGFFWRAAKAVVIDFGKAYWLQTGTRPLPTAMPDFMTRDQMSVLTSNSGKYTDVFLKSENAKRADLKALGVSLSTLFQFLPNTEKKSPIYKACEYTLATLKDEKLGYKTVVDTTQSHLNAVVDATTLFPPIRIRTFTSRSAEIPREILRLVDTPAFQNERRIYQLGMTQHVYPGATHNRFVHSLGVLDIANQYVESLRHSDHQFGQTYDGTKHVTLLAYALLHDIGHYPFAHYLEEIRLTDFVTDIKNVVHHEALGKLRYLNNGSKYLDAKLVNALSALRVDFSASSLESILGPSGNRTVWGGIIDGPLDADKADYLIRDGIACGVPYAQGIDLERLISSLTSISLSDGAVLGITGKGVAPASELLVARYHMYSEVYFHKVCRSIAAIIKKAFWLVENAGLIHRDEFLSIATTATDDAFLQWLSSKLELLPVGARDGANFLIQETLISGHRKLYKRVATLYDAYEDDATQLTRALTKCSKMNMTEINSIESRISAKIKDQTTLRVPNYALLLDIPPPGKDVDLPYVRDTQPTGRRKKLDEVSPTCAGIKDSLKKSKKVRLFVQPDFREELRNKVDDRDIKRWLIETINS
jgi:uncharacterized protein